MKPISAWVRLSYYECNGSRLELIKVFNCLWSRICSSCLSSAEASSNHSLDNSRRVNLCCEATAIWPELILNSSRNTQKSRHVWWIQSIRDARSLHSFLPKRDGKQSQHAVFLEKRRKVLHSTWSFKCHMPTSQLTRFVSKNRKWNWHRLKCGFELFISLKNLPSFSSFIFIRKIREMWKALSSWASSEVDDNIINHNVMFYWRLY